MYYILNYIIKRGNKMLGYDESTLKKLQGIELIILKDFISLCEKHSLTYYVAGGTAIGAFRHKGFIPWDDDIDVNMPREDYDKFLEIAQTELADKYNVQHIDNTDGYVLTFAKMNLKGTTFIEATDTNRTYEQGIFIDIFPMDKLPSDEKEQQNQIKKTFFWARVISLCEYASPKLPKNINPIVGAGAKIALPVLHGALRLVGFNARKAYRHYLSYAEKYNGSDEQYYIDYACLTPLVTKVSHDDIFVGSYGEFEGMKVRMLLDHDRQLRVQYGDYMQLPPEYQRHNHRAEIIDFGEY